MDENSRINGVIEHIIERTKIVPYNKNNKAIDFKEDDVVKCSYLSGLFKVFNINPDRNLVCIYNVDFIEDLQDVNAQFLQKVEVSEKALKVLFNG